MDAKKNAYDIKFSIIMIDVIAKNERAKGGRQKASPFILGNNILPETVKIYGYTQLKKACPPSETGGFLS
ncbi:hypothetical protein DCCM_0036 [Desulfocucumis palustris]|uniref:Uncharacterized protein n=1 Tax=Desulfocucumis palustris TaxID=1898651 RepID=A0A2L2X7B5_9FIRM|nr:hypothetical protein DCCM_0036 [Desulfocucumis palustris]